MTLTIDHNIDPYYARFSENLNSIFRVIQEYNPSDKENFSLVIRMSTILMGQQGVATAVGTSHSTVCRWMHGENTPYVQSRQNIMMKLLPSLRKRVRLILDPEMERSL